MHVRENRSFLEDLELVQTYHVLKNGRGDRCRLGGHVTKWTGRGLI